MKTYSIKTFGCQMNHSDSERIAAVCQSMGYKKASEYEIADLYVVNSCSVRQKAEDRVYGLMRNLQKLKSKKPEIKTVLTGCMAKRDIRQGQKKSLLYQQKYQETLKKQIPALDIVIEISEIHKLPEILGEKVNINPVEYLSIKPKYNSIFQAFVPISTGCNKFCTFCIVPFTRGEEVYRPYEEIYNEVQSLVTNNYKEITLLGQNVNSWRSDTTGHLKIPIPKYRDQNLIPKEYLDFPYLIESLADIEGDFWLRFTSSHPYDINPRLIEVIAQKDNIAKQVHFALQSGSDSVLRRMNRYYTVSEFKEKVDFIRRTIPNVAITTDIIVGFCGETDQEFEETLKVCEEIKFDQIYIAEYSQRQGTIAAKFYKDDIPIAIKAQRKQLLEEVLKKGALENNKRLIGTTQKALVYQQKKGKKDGLIARTTHGKDVFIECNEDCSHLIGNFVYVKIQQAKEFVLEGSLIK
jgi:tRNA-2-methylthio-N6-dimethylallyladenosine synthase